MTDKMRWRYGDTNPVIAAVDSTTVIEIGDLVYLDTDDAKPASSQTDQGTETDNQTLFADNFLGVAMQRSRSGDADPIRSGNDRRSSSSTAPAAPTNWGISSGPTKRPAAPPSKTSRLPQYRLPSAPSPVSLDAPRSPPRTSSSTSAPPS